jgi:8-oxo-dGTP pyrophosphatase MutT (NUDIX family)
MPETVIVLQPIIDKSYGIIPVFATKPRQYLLIYQAKGYWSFPKGHKELSESDLQTARRELFEETGIENVRLINNKRFSCTYKFFYEKMAISKTVTYLLGYVKSQEVHVDNIETINFFWGDYVACREKLGHKTNKRLLESVDSYLNVHAF